MIRFKCFLTFANINAWHLKFSADAYALNNKYRIQLASKYMRLRSGATTNMKWKNTAVHKCGKQSMSVNFNFEGIFIFMLMVCEKHSQRTYEVLREKIRFGFRLKGYKNMYFMCAPLPFHSSEWSNAGCTLPVRKFIKCAMITGILCLCNCHILPLLYKKIYFFVLYIVLICYGITLITAYLHCSQLTYSYFQVIICTFHCPIHFEFVFIMPNKKRAFRSFI